MKADIERLDRLTRQRLARLGQESVATANLERRLEASLWQSRQSPRPGGRRGSRLVRFAVAAIVAIAAGGFLAIQGGGTPVVAAPVAVAQLHRDLMAGQVPSVPVSSIEQARRYLTAEWNEAPPLPNPEAATVTACCRQNLQNRKVACVLLDYRDQRVTMMVGRSRELVCGAKHEEVMHHGRHYAVHQSDELQMVMIEQKGLWICLMGQGSVEGLMDLADSLQF